MTATLKTGIVQEPSSSIANLTLSSSGGVTFGAAATTNTITSAAATALTLQSAGTTAMTIDTSQNVGIGTTSPSTYTNSKLASYAATGDVWNSTDAAAATAGSGFHFYNNGTLRGEINTGGSSFSAWGGANSFNILGFANAPMTFATNSAERMRIDGSGRLFVNSTSDVGTNNPVFSVNAANAGTFSNIMEARWTGTSSIYHLLVRNGNGLLGGVQSSGSTVSYTGTSDYRLKENVKPIQNGLQTVLSLKPITYDWIIDKSAGEGFLAHELQSVIPLAVVGEKDAVNDDGSIKAQGVDLSKIVVHLVAALQELSAKVDAQAAEITALQAKVGA